MEKGLIEKDREGGSGNSITWNMFVQEVKDVCLLALPMISVTFSQYFLQIISMTMVGHLGKLALSSTSIATSLCNVSGFSLLYGLSSALETQCGQAYGAKQYRKFGVQIHTAIISLIIACVPISLLWLNLGNLLSLLGQDPLISQQAGKYAMCMIPALFAYATLQAIIRYFLMQSLIFPLVISSCITLCFHIPFSWLLVFKSGLGFLGAALSVGTSYWLNVTILLLYMKFSVDCEKTCVPISMEPFLGVREFFRHAIPSAGMICLQCWSFELLIVLSGFLPNPQLETSVLSICLQIVNALYQISEATGSAASIKVSNALGAGCPEAAQLSVYAAITLAVSEGICMSSIIFSSQRILGYIFSNEQDVVDYVTDLVPLISLSVLLEIFYGTVSGIARGSGWQKLGACVNLGAYYVLAIPIAVILGYWADLRGKGLWIGTLFGDFCQALVLFLITSFTNWEKQATKARERIFNEALK